MANKKIKLAKKFEDLPTPRHTAMMDEIENETQTDRAVAIIGAAYVDLVLRDAIATKLRPDDALLKELFENRGPFQEFASRIQVTYALSLCGSTAREDLRTIKDIRNAFAHSAEAIGFDHQDIARLCETLSYPKFCHVKNHPDPRTPRQQYIRAIALLTDMFLQQKIGLAPEPLLMAEGPLTRKTVKEK